MNPKVFNSKTKAGAIIYVIAALVQIWLPIAGVTIEPVVDMAIGSTVEVIGIGLAAWGLRDAIFKTQNEVVQTKLEQPK